MPRNKQPYHHDGLEDLLIQKAAQIIARAGVEALSLRGLGEAAGVSRTAAYHYFPDKAALLARVGQRGFGRLRQQIEAAAMPKRTPLARVRAGFAAYVDFAVAEPDLFRVMFANVLERSLDASQADAGPGVFSSSEARAAFQLMVQGVSEALALSPQTALVKTNVIWAFAHGVAVLALGDNLKAVDHRTVLNEGLRLLLAAKP